MTCARVVLGDILIAGAVGPLHDDIDLRGNAEVEDLRHHIRRLRIEQHIRKFAGEIPTQLFDDLERGRMALFQGDLDGGRR